MHSQTGSLTTMDAPFAGDASDSRVKPANLVQLLRWRAVAQPERVAYTFLVDGETSEVCLTFGELDLRARAIGTWLQSAGAAGERVLLLYPPGIEYITAFFGCLYAGAVAIPAYPPRLNQKLFRIQTILEDASVSVVLTSASILSRTESLFAHTPYLKMLRWVDTESIASSLSAKWRDPLLGEDSLALLQYTSGSTAEPKGVMVSHGNLLYSEQMIQTAFDQNEDSVIVGWLPLYHDMGLIGNVLQPLYVGGRCVLMSPVAFLQRPFRWLHAISNYRATTSGGPNFAYDLCVQRSTPEERAMLDLSSWSVAFNGAEPVRAETMERFANVFASCGFRRESFYPCYGLAEATLIVSGKQPGTLPAIKTVNSRALEQHRVIDSVPDTEDERRLVSCGDTLLEQRRDISRLEPRRRRPRPRHPAPRRQAPRLLAAASSFSICHRICASLRLPLRCRSWLVSFSAPCRRSGRLEPNYCPECAAILHTGAAPRLPARLVRSSSSYKWRSPSYSSLAPDSSYAAWNSSALTKSTETRHAYWSSALNRAAAAIGACQALRRDSIGCIGTCWSRSSAFPAYRQRASREHHHFPQVRSDFG